MSEDREDIKKTLINEAEKAEEVRAPEETRIYDARETRVAGKPAETKIFRQPSSQAEDEKVTRKDGFKAAAGKAAEAGSKLVGAGRQGVSDLRKVRVADKRKFSRFIKIIGVFVLILVLELGYFVFASHVKKMPAEIQETQKELELTQEENKLLEEEIDELGDYDSVEELKASWERLKDKVDKAAAGTYY